MKERFINALLSTGRDGIENLISWLENGTDFFTAPASTKYHLSREGGLLEHSLNVYTELKKELNVWTHSATIVSLLHDVCKANYYKQNTKKQKNKDGIWEDVTYYSVDDLFPLGHGEKSVILLQKYIKLTDEEIIAIRFHMGGFESKDNYRYLSDAFNKCSLAVELHIADLKATYFTENEFF